MLLTINCGFLILGIWGYAHSLCVQMHKYLRHLKFKMSQTISLPLNVFLKLSPHLSNGNSILPIIIL